MELAERGQFTVAPNPLVGCVIVSADGRIIGQGWHTAFGQAHAEVEAYQSVSPADQPLLAESTWYVTLEPCNHVGQTPACAPSSNASHRNVLSSVFEIQILRLQEVALNDSGPRAFKWTWVASKSNWLGRTVGFDGMRKPSVRGSSSNGRNPEMASWTAGHRKSDSLAPAGSQSRRKQLAH